MQRLILGLALASAISAVTHIETARAETATLKPYAELSEIAGAAFVNRGEFFVEVERDAILVQGDRVLMTAEATGTLAYAGGCEQALAANLVITVDATGCAFSRRAAASGPDVQGIRPAQGVNIGNLDLSAWELVLIGVGAGGLVWLLVELFDEDDLDPISP